ncbi:MAG: hypothetical protein WBA93_15235 [Microcoleaceae cyanobacterium]
MTFYSTKEQDIPTDIDIIKRSLNSEIEKPHCMKHQKKCDSIILVGVVRPHT